MSAARTFQPVRRNSYDVDDPRAQVFQPLEGGNNLRHALWEVVVEWGEKTRKFGKVHELSANTGKIMRALMRCADAATGVCEPCIDTIMQKADLSRVTVVRGLALLRQHGFVDWVRRTMPTDNQPGEGPQVKQVSNAYFFDLARMPREAMMLLRQKLRRMGTPLGEPRPKREARQPIFAGRALRRATKTQEWREDLSYRLANAKPTDAAAILFPHDAEKQREYNEMLFGPGGGSASLDTGLNPSCRTNI